MNKILTRIVGAVAGLAMAIGVCISVNVKRIEPLNADASTYQKVGSLTAGDQVLIVAYKGTKYYYLPVDGGSSSAPSAVQVTVSNNAISDDLDANLFTVEANETNWRFKNDSGYLYTTSNNNGLRIGTNSNNIYEVTSENTANQYFSMMNTAVSRFVGVYNTQDWRSYNTKDASNYGGSGVQVMFFKKVGAKALSSISVQTPPTKTTYAVGECFNPAGLVITRTFDDSSTDTFAYAGHTNQFSFSPNLTTPLTVENTSVSITYNEKTVSQPILVRTITAVTLMGDMTNKNYFKNDEWDLSGLYLSLTWSAGDPTTVDLTDLTKDTDYLLSEDNAQIGITSLDVYGNYEGFDFAKTITGITVSNRPIVDLLRTNSSSLNYTTNSYGSVSNITKTGHADINSEATYAGYFMSATNPRAGAIQLNPSKSTFICTTASSQLLKSVSVDFNDANSNGVKFYGSNTAYTATYNASGSASSTELGTLEDDGTIDVTGNYKYLYIVPTGTTYVNSFSVVWKSAAEEVLLTLKTSAMPAYSNYTDNGDGTFDYENLGIRFTGLVKEELYDRLNRESTIQGYGVLLSTSEFLGADELKTKYNAVDDSNVKKFDNTETDHEPALKETPTHKEDYYVWNLYKKVNISNVNKEYVAVAYIKLAGNQVVFLDEVRATLKGLAKDLIDNDPNYSASTFGGSLNYLANL